MTDLALSNWQEQYMTASQAYPIVSCEKHIVPLLKNDFTRAVVVRHPALATYSDRVSVLPDDELADLYWHDENHPRKRRASGHIVHTNYLTVNDIIEESAAANIRLNEEDVTTFTHKCNEIRDLFARVYNAYTDRAFEAIRGFTLFTPIGGRGRSPELHIDNTILTIHWAAARATFRVHDGELDDDVWNALSMVERKKKTPEDQTKDFERLIALANDPSFAMVENQVGDLMITKGQLGLDLSDPIVRQQMCVHVSSPTIQERGQAGFLMTPQIPKA